MISTLATFLLYLRARDDGIIAPCPRLRDAAPAPGDCRRGASEKAPLRVPPAAATIARLNAAEPPPTGQARRGASPLLLVVAIAVLILLAVAVWYFLRG